MDLKELELVFCTVSELKGVGDAPSAQFLPEVTGMIMNMLEFE